MSDSLEPVNTAALDDDTSTPYAALPCTFGRDQPTVVLARGQAHSLTKDASIRAGSECAARLSSMV